MGFPQPPASTAISALTVTAQPPADGLNPTSTSRGFYRGVTPSQPAPGALSQGPASKASSQTALKSSGTLTTHSEPKRSQEPPFTSERAPACALPGALPPAFCLSFPAIPSFLLEPSAPIIRANLERFHTDAPATHPAPSIA